MRAGVRVHRFEVRYDERVRWVVIAFDRTFSYAKLNTALPAVSGAPGSSRRIPIARARWRGARSRTARA